MVWIAMVGWYAFAWMVLYHHLAPALIIRMGWHEQLIEVETSWPTKDSDLSYHRPTLRDMWRTRNHRQHVTDEPLGRVVLTRVTVRDPATRQRLLNGSR